MPSSVAYRAPHIGKLVGKLIEEMKMKKKSCRHTHTHTRERLKDSIEICKGKKAFESILNIKNDNITTDAGSPKDNKFFPLQSNDQHSLHKTVLHNITSKQTHKLAMNYLESVNERQNTVECHICKLINFMFAALCVSVCTEHFLPDVCQVSITENYMRKCGVKTEKKA